MRVKYCKVHLLVAKKVLKEFRKGMATTIWQLEVNTRQDELLVVNWLWNWHATYLQVLETWLIFEWCLFLKSITTWSRFLKYFKLVTGGLVHALQFKLLVRCFSTTSSTRNLQLVHISSSPIGKLRQEVDICWTLKMIPFQDIKSGYWHHTSSQYVLGYVDSLY